MSQVKHNVRDNTSPPRTGVKLGYAVDRVEERTGPGDVGEQALIRGLATAFRPHPYTIDVCGSSPLMLTATQGPWARSSAKRLERSTAPGCVTPFEMPRPRD